MQESRPPSSVSSFSGSWAPGQVIAERYRVVALIGEGGMGEVYLADDLTLGEPVALKFLAERLANSESALEQFRSEVRLAREVTHPNVARVHDIGAAEGRPFLSMEFVDGEDLASLVRRIGRLPTEKAIEIARQICSGLGTPAYMAPEQLAGEPATERSEVWSLALSRMISSQPIPNPKASFAESLLGPSQRPSRLRACGVPVAASGIRSAE